MGGRLTGHYGSVNKPYTSPPTSILGLGLIELRPGSWDDLKMMVPEPSTSWCLATLQVSKTSPYIKDGGLGVVEIRGVLGCPRKLANG